MPRTRCYRSGVLTDEDFPIADVSEHLADESAVVWIDLSSSGLGDLQLVADENQELRSLLKLTLPKGYRQIGAEVVMRAPHQWFESLTIDQGFERYTPEEHRTWLTLYDRQMQVLPGRAADAFLKGLEALDLRGEGVPDFTRVSERLRALTGWSVVAVPGLVPDEVFFDHLANRRFPAGNFIRKPDQLDYLQEPDVFTTCSATSLCSPIRCSPTTCRSTARAGAGPCRSGG